MLLKSLITSEARIKLLLKFFLNPDTTGYLRQLANEFNESTNGIRVELNKLTESQILDSYKEGRNVIYKANKRHPLFEDIRNIILKSTGIDKVINNILNKIGNMKLAFIRGDYAIGKDSGLIELVVIGSNINKSELERVRKKTAKIISRQIAVLVFSEEDFSKVRDNLFSEPVLILLEK